MAHTNDGPMTAVAGQSAVNLLYSLFIGMEIVPAQFGGLIPTDIQGMYWSGLQGVTTCCEAAYYAYHHTTEDTPDKVDTAFLAQSAMGIARKVAAFDHFTLATFAKHDSKVWNPTVQTTTASIGDLVVDVTALDAEGAMMGAAQIQVWVDVDDFTRAFEQVVTADDAGRAEVTVPEGGAGDGPGRALAARDRRAKVSALGAALSAALTARARPSRFPIDPVLRRSAFVGGSAVRISPCRAAEHDDSSSELP